jgi:trk system potassium uptake protein
MRLRRKILKAHPATFVLASFLLAITVGTLMLKLPISTKADHPLGGCNVHGHLRRMRYRTGGGGHGELFHPVFGQCVILLLIQIGGLGVMTISVFLFRWIGRNISFRQRMAMQDLFAHTPREDIFSLVKSIVLFTLVAELIGAVAMLSIHWSRELPILGAIYFAVFHSVSAFCNAGFALLLRQHGAL